jgi:hypothetical protein
MGENLDYAKKGELETFDQIYLERSLDLPKQVFLI